MKSIVLSLWLFSLLGGESPEKRMAEAFRNKKLTKAAFFASLAKRRSRKRKESHKLWRAQRVAATYFASRIAMLRKRPKEAAALLEEGAKKYSIYKYYIHRDWVRAHLAAKQWKQAAAIAQRTIKEVAGWTLRREMRRLLGRALHQGKQWSALAEHWRKLLWYPGPYGGRQRVMWNMTMAYVRAADHTNGARWLRQFQIDYPKGLRARKARRILVAWQKAGKAKAKPWTDAERSRRLYRMTSRAPTTALQIIKRRLQAWKAQHSKDVGMRDFLWRLQGRALMRLRRFKDAIPVWKRLKKKTLNIAYRRYATVSLGKAYNEIGEFAKAFKVLHKFAETAPETKRGEKAAFQAALLAIRLQKYDKAKTLIDEYLTVYPDSRKRRTLQWYKAWTVFRQGKYRKAIVAFRRWGRQKPSYRAMRRVRYWSARAYERRGRWDRAKRLYVRVAKASPFSYYGIQAQHRLYLLEDKIHQMAKAQSCHRVKNHKSFKSLRLHTSPLFRKKKRKKTWQRILDQRIFGVTNAWERNSRKKGRLAAEAPVPKQARFPSVPGFCYRALGSRSCRALVRAEFFAHVGLLDEAVQELYAGRYALRRRQRVLVSAIQWLLSVGAFHESLRYSLYLRRVRNPLDLQRLLQLRYPRAFVRLIVRESRRFQVPFAFSWAIMREESHFRSRSRSWVGARGLMQIMPSTGRKIADRLGLKTFSTGQLYHPNVNVRMGCWYLGQLLQKFENNVMLAAASYNAGPHRVAVWLKHHRDLDADEFVEEIPFRETRFYVKKVFRSYIIYNFLYRRSMPPQTSAVAVRVGKNINF